MIIENLPNFDINYKQTYITWFISDLRIQATCACFPTTHLSIFRTRQFHNNTMQIQTKETRIVLAIEAIYTIKKLSVRHTAQMYEVSESTIRNRIKGCLPKAEKRNA